MSRTVARPQGAQSRAGESAAGDAPHVEVDDAAARARRHREAAVRAVGEVDVDVLAGPPCGRLEAGNLERQVDDIGSQRPDSLDDRRVPRRLGDGREHALGADHELAHGPRLADQRVALLGLLRRQRHRRFLVADRAFEQPDAAGAAAAERAVVRQAHALTQSRRPARPRRRRPRSTAPVSCTSMRKPMCGRLLLDVGLDDARSSPAARAVRPAPAAPPHRKPCPARRCRRSGRRRRRLRR